MCRRMWWVILAAIAQDFSLLELSAQASKFVQNIAECNTSMSNVSRKRLAREHLDAGKTARAIETESADLIALKHFRASINCLQASNAHHLVTEAKEFIHEVLKRSKSAHKDVRSDFSPGKKKADPASLAANAAYNSEADAEFQKAVRLSGAGDTAGAARAFARTVALQPANALAWSNLGVVRQQASVLAPTDGRSPPHFTPSHFLLRTIPPPPPFPADRLARAPSDLNPFPAAPLPRPSRRPSRARSSASRARRWRRT